jgi:hypothetical protein
MWLRTSAETREIYNLSAFEAIGAAHDPETGRWLVQAMDREGHHRVLLAETDDQQGADNLVAHIAHGLKALDLGRG